MPGFAHVADPGLSTVVSGAYRALWDDLDIGLTLDGYTLRQTNSGIDITADITGDTILDTIYSGTILTITMTLENWNAQAIEPMIWWHGASTRSAYEWGLSDGVGQRHWDAARPLILYACQSTGFSLTQPANPDPDTPDATVFQHASAAEASNPTIDPLDIVFPKTLLKKDTDLDILFSFRPRYLTLTLDVFPISNMFDGTAFDETAPDSVERVNDCSKIRYFAATRGQGPTTPGP